MKEQDKTIKEKETEKINDKKINKKKIILYIVGLAIVIYLLYTIYLLIKEPTNIVTVEEGKLYQEETDIGYVIRDEKVVKGENYKNGMEQIIAEGERASNNENIFRYYSANEESLKQKISELDAKIQEVMLNDKSLLTADIKLLENQIDEKLEDISKITDVTKLTEYKKEIDNLITKKAKMAGESSPKGSYLRQLIEERKNCENQLNSGAEYVKAPMSGIVSYCVDGLEETLTPDNFSALSKEYLESLNLKTGKIVATNEECGKVINNFVCYIATITSSEEAKQAKVGDEIKVRLSNNVEVSAEISNIVKEDEDYQTFKEALYYVNEYLAKCIASDGEGATKLLEVNVNGAKDVKQAKVVAKSVCTSPLVKTAIFGNDANWGRLLCAMGYSGEEFDPYQVDLYIESEFGNLKLVENGMATDYSEEKATQILSSDYVKTNIDMKMGNEKATAWGCDLTYDYVKINADYRS